MSTGTKVELLPKTEQALDYIQRALEVVVGCELDRDTIINLAILKGELVYRKLFD